MRKSKSRNTFVFAALFAALAFSFLTPEASAQAVEIRPSDTINWTDASPTAPLFYEVLVVNEAAGVSGTPVVRIANHTTTGVATPTSLGGSALFGPSVVSGNTYDFFIRGEDAAGNKGPWSAPFTVTLINTDLVAPGGFTVTMLFYPPRSIVAGRRRIV